MKLSSFRKSIESKKELTPKTTSEIEQQLWKPQDGPQTQAFETEADECLFGGSAGGGKSALLIIIATLQHKRSIIFRREYPRLKDIIEKSRKVLTGIARYNSVEKIWRGIPGDRTLEFGAVQYEDSKESWRGIEHDLKAFDELGEFTRSQYEFLITWNRSTDKGVKCRVVATCNPPSTEEAEWIKEYWGAWLKPEHDNPAIPGELRWYANIDGLEKELKSGEPFEHGGERIIPRSRTFIPARLEDNAYLKDTNYRGNLQRLPEPLRSQLLYGDFTTSIKEDHPWQVIPSAWVEAAMKRWNSVVPAQQTHLGVDVARGGKDESIIAQRHAFWVAPLIALPGQSTPDGETLAAQILAARKTQKVEIRIDVVGVGSSPYDAIKRRGVKNIIGVNAGRASDAKDRSEMLGFFNLRSQVWWQFRELLDPTSGFCIALPRDPKLKADLTTPRWKNTLSRKEFGEIRIESRDEIIKRLGRSPDRGTAVVYAFADVPTESDGFDWLANL